MPNQTASGFEVSADGKTLTVHGQTINYVFPYTGPALATRSDLAAMQAAILAALQSTLQADTIPDPAPMPTPTPVPTPTQTYPQGWTSLTLSPGDNLTAAISVAAKGFQLKLTPGRYTQTVAVPAGLDGWDIGGTSAAEVVIDGGGGLTVAQNNVAAPGTPGRLAHGKGVIWAGSPGTVHDLELTHGGSNATDGHDGQAGLYAEFSNGTLTARNVMFRRNQNGIFGNAANNSIAYVVDHCDFVDNSTDGGSHDTYIQGTGASVATFTGCTSNGAPHGNDFKTRVATVHMQDCHLRSQGGRWIELADGGTLDVKGGVWIGQDFGQNVFGNGTESTDKGPGNTTLDSVTIYLGNRPMNFSNAGTFLATNCTVIPTGNASSVFNDKGLALAGLPAFAPQGALPPAPAYVSGAK